MHATMNAVAIPKVLVEKVLIPLIVPAVKEISETRSFL